MMRYGRLIPATAVLFAAAAALLGEVNILGHWWENPEPYQETPKGLVSIRAKDCGVCHQAIYREWQLSTHAHALSDMQFQAEMHKDPSTQWICLNCHTPLINQRAEYAVAVKNDSVREPVMETNPRYDAKLEQEAVTCAVCHVRDGYILGPYGDSNAPHPVRKSESLLTEKVCTKCHQATASYSTTLICTFDTGQEWRESPYSKQGRYCSHCHMPEVDRAIAPGGPVRKSRRHYFVGSMIPKEVLGSLNGLPLNPRGLYRSGLSVEVEGVAPAGGETEVRLRLKNAYAGHLLPTGDPERFILVEVTLTAGEVELGAQTLRIGQKWEWWPKAKKLADNRLAPLAERTETLRFSGAAHGPFKVAVRVINARISEEAAAYHGLSGKYPTRVVVQSFARRFE